MGRPDFSTAGTGSSSTVAVESKPTITMIDASQSSTVAPGDREIVEIFSPEGAQYQLTSMQLRVEPTEGANGDHSIVVTTAGWVSVLVGRAFPNGRVHWDRSTWQSAGRLTRPSSEAAQLRAAQSLRATPDDPIRIVYRNDTDSEQTDERTYLFVVEEVTA